MPKTCTAAAAELRDARATVAVLQLALDRAHQRIRDAEAIIERQNAALEQAGADRERVERQLAEARDRLEQSRAAKAAADATIGATARRQNLRLSRLIPRP